MTQFNLQKGGRFDLAKEAPGLTKIKLGLGWKPNTYDTGSDFDLDVSLFVCAPNAQGKPKLIADPYFVFYNQPKTPDGAIEHTGDSRKGEGDGDDEVINIDLSKLDPRGQEISIIVTIHEAVERRQTFGQVDNSYIKLYNAETGTVLMEYKLENDFSGETAVQFGSLYKDGTSWKFKAVGAGFKKGLGDFVNIYCN